MITGMVPTVFREPYKLFNSVCYINGCENIIITLYCDSRLVAQDTCLAVGNAGSNPVYRVWCKGKVIFNSKSISCESRAPTTNCWMYSLQGSEAIDMGVD